MKMLQSVNAAFERQGFKEDVRLISQASAADFMQANKSQDVISMANSKKTCRRVQLALRQLLFSTSMVLLTDGYRQRCRHLGHALNLYFGALNGFSTHNFADGYHPLLYQLADHNSINLTRQAPLLPTLQTMHKLTVGCPAAAARLFLLLEELSYRHLFSVTAKIGSLSLRRTCASIEEDDYASTAVPGVLGFTDAIFEPLESQGRGCIPHGHRKIYSTPNALTSLETLLQKAVSKDNESASQSMDKALDEEVKKLNSQLIATAASCQYESASLLGKDLGITVRDEPFSAKEQKQSKFDGLMETDGETQRLLIPVCEPDQFAHVAAEAQTAANERRNPRHSYKEIDLTTCQLSIFPHYRLPTRILDVPATTEDGCLNNDRMADYPSGFPWRVNEHGQFTGFYLQNGDATQFDFVHDANAWAESHARDFRFLHCNNHTHACTASCLKYSKKTTAEKTQLLKGKKTPGCRHNFWRIVALKVKQGIDTVIHRIRRRGKDLVFFPCIATTNSQNEFGLVQVIRNMPFRSPTNDVIQVTCRCNSDFRYMGRGVPEETDVAIKCSDLQLAACCHISIQNLHTPLLKKVVRSILALHVAAHNCDFYITKYQSKPMEMLQNVVTQFALGLQRLEDELATAEPLPTYQKAKRVVTRLAMACNRSSWVSATEMASTLMSMMKFHCFYLVACFS